MNDADIDAAKKQMHAHFADGDFAAAEIVARRLVDAAPGDVKACYNLATILAKLDRVEESAALCRKAIALDPSFAFAHTNLGFCLAAQNDIAGARTAFAEARRLTSDNPIPALNEGMAALALGDYEPGWRGFAARWQMPAYAKFRRGFPVPYWQGEDIAGKTLFLFAEQGFGDTIQMARYIPFLAARGINIVLETPQALTQLMRHSLKAAAHIIAKGDSIPHFDYFCAMMDVPGAFGTRVDTVPAAVPYLFADEKQTAHYRAVSNAKKPRRIGICWAGRASHENDRNRSSKFAEMKSLLARQDIEWVSLQRLVPDGDAAELAAGPVLDWGSAFLDFNVASAAIMACDIVISVDTAVAHLAGALGKPVWVLLPFYADWRWLMHREDSPWYPTARLFRQKKRGDWSDVIAQIAAAL